MTEGILDANISPRSQRRGEGILINPLISPKSNDVHLSILVGAGSPRPLIKTSLFYWAGKPRPHGEGAFAWG
jgi:hypothetical protein